MSRDPINLSNFDLIDLLTAGVITPEQLANLLTSRKPPISWWRRIFQRKG